MNTKTIHLNQITEEYLSPIEFVKLKSGEKVNISYTEVVPPRLGHRDFGKIKVHYKRPVYK